MSATCTGQSLAPGNPLALGYPLAPGNPLALGYPIAMGYPHPLALICKQTTYGRIHN
jgi:hypothetical protein